MVSVESTGVSVATEDQMEIVLRMCTFNKRLCSESNKTL